jgi:hypothetical protein
LLNLAECHRRQGKTATAWAEFDTAIRIGVQVKFPEAVATATKLRDELAKHMSRVTVVVPPAVAALPGLSVELDGKPLPQPSWNAAANHDPGAVVVTASAKGYKRFERRIDLGADSDNQSIEVALEAEPPPPPPKPPPPSTAPPPAPLWPWIVGGVGVALGVAAIAFEVDSTAAGSTLDQNCGGSARNQCPPGYDFSSPRGRELRGFGLFVGLGIAGLAAIGTGATVILTHRFGGADRAPAATGLERGSTGTQVSLGLSPTSATVTASF